MAKQNIVILGAGFGGLRAAVLLSKKIRQLALGNKYEVILVDKNDYQIFTPALYEIATTSKKTANYNQLKEIAAFPIAKLLKNLPITFVHSAVEKLDLLQGDIHCQDKKLKYDYLVLAIGSETNYFDIPGLKENSLPLKSFIDALAIRNRILNAASEGRQSLRVVVGGGGSTGVELAGEIEEWLCELKEEIRECHSEVILIEAAPTILPGFDQRIVNKARSRLTKLGVQILLNEAVAKVLPNKITLKSNREIAYDIFVWTGGVKASNLMAELPLKTEEKRRQVTVLESMECLPSTPDLKLYGKIYGIGDAICFYDPVTKKPIPKVARAAIIQAGSVANNIIADIKAKEEMSGAIRHKTYQPTEYPYIIPVGGKYAIAKIGPLIISGLLAWLFKLVVEFNYLLSIMPFAMAIKTWLRALKIFIQNDRLG